jgi:DNA-binding transcriptional LysR family regulator
MNIDEIQTFVVIAQLGGFTRAAEKLHRSQPAISRRISLLERELETELLERIRGGVRLTPAGEAFLPHAEAMLAAVGDGREAVRVLLRERGGRLSLALVGTLADTRIVELLREFSGLSQGVKVELRTATSREVSDLVRRGEVTLGLRYFPDHNPGLVCETVGAEAMQVVVAAGHRLAGKHVDDALDLRAEQWVGFPAAEAEPESHGNLLQRQLAGAGLMDVQVTLLDSLTAQKRLVEAGFGIALLPASSVREELRLGSLASVDAPALSTSVPIALVTRKRGFLSPAAQALSALIRDEAERL